jgi:hypothetical protein
MSDPKDTQREVLRSVDPPPEGRKPQSTACGGSAAGEMTMTTTLTEAEGGTDVVIVHEGIPDSVPAADNEIGTRMALENLAKLVEAKEREARTNTA